MLHQKKYLEINFLIKLSLSLSLYRVVIVDEHLMQEKTGKVYLLPRIIHGIILILYNIIFDSNFV